MTGEAAGLPDIRVEFPRRPGLREVSVSNPELLQKSVEALDRTMTIVRGMAHRLQATVGSMGAKPSEVALSFGVKFDAEVGAMIAKTAMEAAVNVTLKWDTADTRE